MESNAVISMEKQSLISGNKSALNVKVVECVREFKLPQVFPSMIKHQKSINKTMRDVKKKYIPTILQSSIICRQSDRIHNNIKLTNKLQTHKLKSPDGRDLDEFHIQMLPQANNNLTTKVVSSPNNTTLSINDTLKNLKPNLDRQKSSDLPIKISPDCVNNNINNLSSPVKYQIKSNEIFNLEKQENLSHGILIPIASNIVKNSNINEHQLKSVNHDLENNIMYIVRSGNDWEVLKFDDREQNEIQTTNNTSITIGNSPYNNEIKKNTVQINPTTGDNIQDVNNHKSVQNSSLKIAELINHDNSKFIQSMTSRIDDVTSLKISGMKRSSDGLLAEPSIKEKKLSHTINCNSNVINTENVHDNGDYNLIYDKINSESNFNKKNDIEKSVSSLRKSYPLRNSHGTVNLIRREKKDSDSLDKQSEKINTLITNEISNNSTNSVQLTAPEKSLKKKTFCLSNSDDISSKLSIVGQALSMISDNELKTKALQALADCGIGLERFVPVKAPLDQMSIKESQTQTNVFGLLDSNDFIRVMGDTDSLSRLQEIERHIIVDDTNISNKSEQETPKFIQELNEILNQRWVNKVNVEKIKQILKVNPVVEKAYSLVEKDFKNAKKYDKNGLLSIHRAILSNQVRGVKRQLMVLRCCKQNIDVPTTYGKTGLELAIENSVSPEIITLLLKSGANPASREATHDSALTIAANEASHFLPQLIKYLSSSDDINHVDSEGFTALHYCVRNNNIDGVLTLIRANSNVNVRDLKSGRTPLFHAFENDYIEIAKELLENGARTDIPNFSSQTVHALFDESKHYLLKDALNKLIK